MKTKLALLTLLISIVAVAQNGINYKALIKDDSGNIIANSSINIQFSILESDTQTNVYEETHAATTDANGIIIVNIGEGNIISGIFNDINWGEYTHFLNVKINTGIGFVDMGTTQFSAVPYAFHAQVAENINGLETIDEGNGIGWRLVGKNPDNYGDVGLNAVDLSGNPTASTVRGATGPYSTALGFGTTASAIYSTAIGRQSTASGSSSTAMGGQTTASGPYSTAMGNGSEASGSSSTALGNSTTASGNFSTAMGFNTTASSTYSTAMGHYTSAMGLISTAMGNNTTAPSFAETVIGTYNTNYTPNASLTWNSADRLFVIGNGESGSRSNAMVVLKNGNTGIGASNPQELLHINGGRLRIGNETIEDGGSDILGFSSSLVPTEDEVDRLGGPNRRWLDVYAANGMIQTSDRRSKTNIANLNYGLAEVLKMQPVSFNWKNKNNPDTKLGLIAQDLKVLVPEVVQAHIWEKDEVSGVLSKKELDRLGVYYSDLVPVLINAIKEQQALINALKLSLDQQKSTITNQENIGLDQAKALESLLNRVNILEQTNNQ
ncbi:tail fiber domain-containing protein [Winogradskyella sp. ECml5-4]|uniref:tail fiber domain-containing protein n=1 Tax=Winogradskyella sp. ECml5-4 TaxID=3110975 RepID=UPI002FF1D905